MDVTSDAQSNFHFKCTACSKEFWYNPGPPSQRIVISQGVLAKHSGSMGGIQMGGLAINSGQDAIKSNSSQVSNDGETNSAEELRLSFWEDWLADADLGGTEAQ
jgi:hypothetical protein